MPLTQSDELGLRLDCPIYCAEPTLPGYDNNVHDLFELCLIVFAVEPFVHARAANSVEPLLRFFDYCHGDGVIRDAFHHLMIQDEALLVLDHAHPQSELHRNACLALADPLRMWLEQGEDFLFVRNALTLQYSTLNLVDLPLGMPHELIELPQKNFRQHDVLKLAAGVARPIQVDLRLLEISAVRLPHRSLLVLTLDL